MSKNNEIMEPEVIENTDVLEPEVYDEPEESGISLGKLALGVGFVAGGIGILCYKFKGKFEEHQVKKLKKKGYGYQTYYIAKSEYDEGKRYIRFSRGENNGVKVEVGLEHLLYFL